MVQRERELVRRDDPQVGLEAALEARTLALVSPFAVTSLTPGRPVNQSTTGAASSAATMKSRSPIVSSPRRRLPAVSARLTWGSARSPATIGSATWIASHHRCRRE